MESGGGEPDGRGGRPLRLPFYRAIPCVSLGPLATHCPEVLQNSPLVSRSPSPPSPVLARRLVVLHRHPLRCRPAFPPFPLLFALACCRSAHKAPSEAERGKGLCVGGAMAGSSKKRGSKNESGEVDVYVGIGGACVAISNRRAGWMWKGPHVWEPGQGHGGDALRETHERRQYVWGDIWADFFFVSGKKGGG